MKCILIFTVAILNFNIFAAPITITQTSNMIFSNVVAGSGPHVVAADTAETASNASFLVEGDKNTAFTIILPTTATISLNGAGMNTLTLSNFTSFPAGTGMLANNRRARVYVGATIATVPISSPAGAYSGSFTVEVLY